MNRSMWTNSFINQDVAPNAEEANKITKRNKKHIDKMFAERGRNAQRQHCDASTRSSRQVQCEQRYMHLVSLWKDFAVLSIVPFETRKLTLASCKFEKFLLLLSVWGVKREFTLQKCEQNYDVNGFIEFSNINFYDK